MSAYGGPKATETFRKTWDRQEYKEKAKEKDEEARKRAEEAEEYLKQGKKPPRKRRDDLPKPTELLKAREGPLELDKNQGKTIVATAAQGSRGPGYYCDVCNRTYKDSIGYLDHINGRSHLRHLGQTTRVARSTLDQVRAKIAALREATADKTKAKKYDFELRLKQIREAEQKSKDERKAKRRLQKQKEAEAAGTEGPTEVMEAMGFANFGGGKR